MNNASRAWPASDLRLDSGGWWIFALLAVCVAAVYGHTLDVPWYLDDERAIVNNPAVHDLARAVREWFAPRGTVTFTFALNAHFGGLVPAGFHLVNIALHLLNGWLVYLLLRRVWPDNAYVAPGAALLFLLHPLQTAAVTYTVQRMTVLAATFFLLALWCQLRARAACAAGDHGRGWFAGAALSAVLAVTAKQNAALWPLAAALLERLLPEPVPGWTAARRRAYRDGRMVVAGIFLGCVAILAWRDLGGGLAGSAAVGEDLTGSGPVSPLRYLVSQGPVLWLYPRLLFFPLGQAVDHGLAPVATLTDPLALSAWGGLLLLGAAAWWWRRRVPVIAVATGWFFLLLAVESSLIPLDLAFEHRLYLPVLAVALLFGAALQGVASPRRRLLLTLAILLPLAMLTWQRNALWRDPAALWTANLRTAPGSSRVFVNAAIETARRGDAEGARRIVTEHLPRFAGNQWLRTNPKFLLNVGLALRGAGDEDAAELYMRRACALGPGLALAHYNLGILLHDRGDRDEAAAYLQQALHLEPDNPEFRFAMAVARLERGERNAALQALPGLRTLAPQRGEQLQRLLAEPPPVGGAR